MILVGLTGGIGAGKSTVSAQLAARGAVIIDADAITRELQQPGQPLLRAIVERFGTDVLTTDGELDRAKLAGIVFTDPENLKALNTIAHPVVNLEINRRLLARRHTDDIVVLDIPLLAEGEKRRKVAATVVVDLPVDVAVARLVQFRGMTEDDARARISRQATREERLALADRVIDNGGDAAALAAQIDELWPWLAARPAATDDDLAPIVAAVEKAEAAGHGR